MVRRGIFTYWLSLVAFGLLTGPGHGEDAPKQKSASLVQLSQEVGVLQTLHALDLTKPQMEKFLALARETSSQEPLPKDPKVSDEFRKTLTDLHRALVANRDDDRIDDLNDKLDDLREAEHVEFDFEPEVTEEARDRAPDALRLLSPRQVAAYVGSFADDVGDPSETLLKSIGEVRQTAPAKLNDFREEVAEEVSRLVGGLDAEKAMKVREQVIQLLIVARGMKEPEFTKEKGALEKKARGILGATGPTEVLRNVMEQTLADLLSNPRLASALEARLKSPETK